MVEQPNRNSDIEDLLKRYTVITNVVGYIDEHHRVGETHLRDMLDKIRISYCNQKITPVDELRDALNRPEPFSALRIEGQYGVLLLIDLEPNANWGHECWISTFDIEYQKVRVVKSQFPPKEQNDQRLVVIDPRKA